jgi:hypothetical protein
MAATIGDRAKRSKLATYAVTELIDHLNEFAS